MVNSVTFPADLGGNGLTYTDDDDPDTGLGNDGHRTRFVPILSQTVLMAQAAKDYGEVAQQAAGSASDYFATSTSELTMAAGSKSIVLAEAGKAFAVDDLIVAVYRTDPEIRLYGSVTAVDSQTLTVSVAEGGVVGSGGPYDDWIVIHGALVLVGATAAEARALEADYVPFTPASMAAAIAFHDDGNVTETYTPDLANGPNHKATLTGNITLAALSNPKEGEGFYLRLAQDDAGSRTISFNSGYKFFGAAPAPSTAASAIDAVSGRVLTASPFVAECVFLKGRTA